MSGLIDLPSPTPHLVAQKDGAVGWLTFSRPDRMNAVSLEMWAALPDLMSGFDKDPEVRVVVLTGAGDRAFVAGADISQFAETREDAGKAANYERINARAFMAIRDFTKPTIAMIDGYCIGGGMAIALSCDLRFAANGSTFAIPAAKLGLAYPIDGMAQVLRVVSPAFAKEIFFTARQFDHDEALAMNLINRAVPTAELADLVRLTCERICANAPLTLRAAKHAIDAMAQHPESFDRSALEAMSTICFDSDDYDEGRRAFLEKRKPKFVGK
jgi:enoyl-CoA hydratase/carnithine racemase